MRNIAGMGSAGTRPDLVCLSQEPFEGLSSGHFLLSQACVNQQCVGSLIFTEKESWAFQAAHLSAENTRKG